MSIFSFKKKQVIPKVDPDTLGWGDNETEGLIDPLIYLIPSAGVGKIKEKIDNLNVIENLTTINYSTQLNNIKYLVVHYTAGRIDNGNAAYANTEYYKSEYHGASAHYFVDCSMNIYRCVPDKYIAWHCGTKNKYYSDCRNSCSLGIEICSYMENEEYKFKDETIEHAKTLIRYLIKKYNIPKDNVIMHYHVTHKVCAAPFMSNSVPNNKWDEFKESLFKEAHWADKHRDSLLDKLVITDMEQWSKYSENVTKGLAVKVISNIIGGEDSFGKLSEYNHWAHNAVLNLHKYNIIEDLSQWEDQELNTPINKGLLLALVDKATGGTISTYKNIDVSEWPTRHLLSLQAKKIIETASAWTDYKTPAKKDIFLALIDKSLLNIIV